ncbi:MAG: hypothetical protein L0Y58_00180, partial [Verrucomicrobia subdivision 3 bacterium]|nr:hypothetical protein [Limisphaerales bacterium]
MTRKRIVTLGGALLLGALQVKAGMFTANFNDCVTLPCLPPVGSTNFGSAVIEPTGGVGDSGVLKLTKNVLSQQGSFVIDDLDAGFQVNGFDLHFKVRVGGGTSPPADGFSVSVAPDVPSASWSEEGIGTGLTVAFDIFDNGGGEAPAIDLKFGGTADANVLRHTVVPISFLRTGTNFVDVNIRVDTDGTVDVVYNGMPVYTDVILPSFQPTALVRYGFGARTGGLHENQWVDDIQLTTTVGPLTLRFIRNPSDANVLAGGTLTLRSAVNDPASVLTYQWQKKAPADPGFTDIAGATEATYTTPALTLADSGTQYKVRAEGINNNAESTVATVTVTSITVPAPTVTFNFDDGMVPPNTAVYGNAAVTIDGGVGGSGVLRLTEPVNDQIGTFVINDFNSSQAQGSMTATFKVRVGGGSTPPADGFSFNWAADIPDGTIGPEAENGGSTTGLTIAFDIFDNGGGEGPSVDVKYGGTVLASTKVPLDMLETGDAFVDVLVRLQPNGQVDVAYNNVILHSGVQLPGWTALANGRFAFSGRTGGLNASQYVDDIGLSTTLFTGPMAFTRQPSNTVVLVGGMGTFTVEVNNPAQATYQWQERAPGGPGFSDIPGATSATFTTPAATLADNGTLYRVVVTGPINTITSSEASLTVINAVRPASPDVLFDFNDCIAEPCSPPAGTAVFSNQGQTRVTPTSVPGGSGVLRLTDAVDGQSGTWIIEDFKMGAAIEGFVAAFNVYVDGGETPPADGYSFNWATDFPNGTLGEAENGAGSGLRIAFDIFDNGGGEAPAVAVIWAGAVVAERKVPIETLETGLDTLKEVIINLESDGTVDVVYGGEVIHHNVQLPGFSSLAGARFGFAARTGGLNENHWLDDVAIKTTLFTGPVAFIREPADTVALVGTTATFSAVVNDPARSTFQWQRKDPGAGSFVNISGATSGSFTTPVLSLADNGAEYRVVVTGPNNTITSRAALLTVITIDKPTPNISLNFDDGAVPAGSVVSGNAFVDTTGGVGGSGTLKLTINQDGQIGSFIITNDVDAGARVWSFVACFQMRVGGGEIPPADGFSFVWASDLEGSFGEEGAGSGLIVAFDIFDNGGGEAPAIDVRFNTMELRHTVVPISLLETDDGTTPTYVPVIVRVENDGTLDVVYDNVVIYHNLPLPGFNGMVGGRFGWGARTGGLNENHWIDDIQIATSTVEPFRLSVTRLPSGQIQITYNGVLQSAASLTGTFTDVAGA